MDIQLFFFLIPGIISCIYKLDSNGENSSRSVNLSVLAPPEVRMSILTVTVHEFEAESLSLTCSASVPNTGHPWEGNGVTFTWSIDGAPITNSNSMYIAIFII